MALPAPHPRVLMLPFPAQGHVMPLMELSHRFADHGVEVYFVNTDFNHARIIKAMEEREAGAIPAGIHMVSFPDGMDPDADRSDIGKLGGGLRAAMLDHLEDLLRSKEIRWMVVDVPMAWALELAATVGVRVALFLPFAAAAFAMRLHAPKMVEDGIVDQDGNVKRSKTIKLSSRMPAIDVRELPWSSVGKTPEARGFLFQNVINTIGVVSRADSIVCNTFEEIESEALGLIPKTTLAVGPLETPKAATPMASHFWPDDAACLPWLDAQAPCSVVYVAFGSLAVFDATQLRELADGLALTGRPFLWVIRPNLANGVSDGWLDEFRRRVGGTGLVVGWAPQQRVLAHPAVACFVTHCGWNSVMEGASHGVPLLCRPHFGDQFCNRSYVCDVWRAGVELCADEQRGVVTKEEIRGKVERLLGDEGIRERAVLLKSAARASVKDGGSSQQNLLRFVNLLRER